MSTEIPQNLQKLKRFIVVSDTLATRITLGLLHPGEQFLSRPEICAEFGISPMTAHRVQRKLLEDGLLVPSAGGRFIVADQRTRRRSIRLVRFLGQLPCYESDRCMEVWSAELEAACRRRGIGFRLELHNLLDEDRHRIDTACNWLPGEGIVSLGYAAVLRRFAGFLLRRDIPKVVLKDFLPCIPQVLTDNVDGLRQLMKHAKQHGAQRLALLNAYENACAEQMERMHLAPLVAAEQGLELSSYHFSDLLDGTVRPGSVEALLATTTMEFNAVQKAVRQWPVPPKLYAFDDPAPRSFDFTGVTRYVNDYHTMCEAVLDYLEIPPSESCFNYTLQKYIPGKLIEGDPS